MHVHMQLVFVRVCVCVDQRLLEHLEQCIKANFKVHHILPIVRGGQFFDTEGGHAICDNGDAFGGLDKVQGTTGSNRHSRLSARRNNAEKEEIEKEFNAKLKETLVNLRATEAEGQRIAVERDQIRMQVRTFSRALCAACSTARCQACRNRLLISNSVEDT
jgi:hypothetical protein